MRGRFAAALFAALSLACEGEEDVDLRRSNLVLVVVDTLRADHLGAWGAGPGRSPFLDELAARSVVFTDTTSPASQTVPSVVSMWTGLHPHRHANRYYAGTRSFRVARVGVKPEVPGSVPILADLLRDAGFATAAIVTNPWLQEEYGFARGFDGYRVLPGWGAEHARGGHVNREARALLETRPDRPLFLYVHYMDAHPPYDPAQPHRRDFTRGLPGRRLSSVNGIPSRTPAPDDVRFTRGLYAASVREVDDHLRALVALLREHALEQDTLLVVVGDHGEEFFEHGGLGHGFGLHQEQVHVPLLFSHPALPPRRIATPVAGVDLLPTLLALLGLPVPEDLDGVSLASAVLGVADAPAGRLLLAETGDLVAARRGARKLIRKRGVAEEPLAYDLSREGGLERARVADATPWRVALDAELLQLLAESPERDPGATEPAALDPDLEERLRKLGYVE